MIRYRLSDQAKIDIKALWEHIAQDNTHAANRVMDQLYQAMLKLGEMPGMGHLREDLTEEPLRFWSVHRYLIIYRPDTDPIDIVRVISGHRDVAGLLA